jgi:hypothetical protein
MDNNNTLCTCERPIPEPEGWHDIACAKCGRHLPYHRAVTLVALR